MTSHFQETESALHAHSLRLTVVRWLTVLLCLCPWPFPASLNVHQTWIPQAMAVTPDTGPQLVSQEIRYHKPEAGEVWLVWGINGWHPVPESTRPASTVVEKGIMYTPMVDKGETFSIKLTVPTGAAINFGFQIRKNRQGTPISWVWDGNYASSRSKDGWTDLESRIGAVTAEQRKAWLAGQVSDLPLITREIRYRLPEAGEVWLVWGIDGWQALPSSVRPIGTVLKDDKLMHTRMTRTGDTFVSTVRFPSGAGFDYKFLITKTKDGTAVNVEDVAESRSPSTTIRMNSSATIESPQVGATALERKAWLAGQASDLPLVTREIRYQLPEAGEVWLVWGIDGWQPIPEAARPSGTAMRNGKMYTAMVRQGQTLAATVRLPPGAVMNYEFVIHTAAGPQSSGKQPWTAVTSLDSRVEVESSLTKAALEQRKTWPSGPLDRLSLVTQEIRFRIAGAEEVWLVWGINGLQPIPGEARPPGTVLKEDQVMRTPMNRKGDMFAATVRVPPQTVLDYKFLVTKTVGGNPADTWQDHDGKDFWKLVRTSGSSEHIATVTVVTAEQRQAWLAGRITGIPLVTQEIQYRAPGALEVWLLWGMDGWKAAPEAARPPGTLFRNAVMQSRMVYSGDTFTAKVRVPPGAVLDYGFLIVKTADGKTVDILENKNKEGEAFTNVAMFDGVTQVKSAAWLSSRASGLSTVAQELRYRIAGAGEVWLVWGINGWQPVPEEARPKGTVLKERVMHSPMIRNGDRFATTVLVPANTIVNYKFLVTKNSREAPLNLLDDLNGQAFQKKVRSSGSLEEHATVTVVTPEQRQAWLAGQLTDLPLVTQEIRYHAPGAEDVWLVWGLDGWQAPPEGARPVGTVIKEKVLRSRMVRKGDSFTATVQVPPGTGLDFWFHIAGSDRGRLVESRQDKDENGRTLSRIVMVDGQIQVRSH